MLSTKENIRAILECNFAGFKDEYIEIALNRIMEIIDDAPEFKITEEQAIDKLHETGWLIKHDKEMTERPHGEWIPDNNLKRFICSNCGAVPSDWSKLHRTSENCAFINRFCRACGADMRGNIE